jgi:hypothetical protein
MWMDINERSILGGFMNPEDNPILEDEDAVYALRYLISCGYEVELVEQAFIYIDKHGEWKEE